MDHGSQGSQAGKDLLLVVGLVVLLGFIWVATGGPDSPAARGGPWMKAPPPVGTGSTFGSSSAWVAPGGTTVGSGGLVSPPHAEQSDFYDDYLSVSLGNIATENRANREYLTLRLDSHAPQPINLTGWLIAGERYRSATTIGQGTMIFGSPNSQAVSVPIILAPGGEAIIVSGVPPRVTPRPPGSFLENACTGYIERDEENNLGFTPRLDLNCPDSAEEPGVKGLDDRCYDLVRRWPRCQTVEIEFEEGVRYLNGHPSNLNQQCRNYLEDHFNYDRCLAWHVGDPNFFGQAWRIFLNRRDELFAKNRETVRIYDNLGRLVFEESYD